MRKGLQISLLAGLLFGLSYFNNNALEPKKEGLHVTYEMPDINRRREKLSDFVNAYGHARDNWDNFDWQFILVRNLVFSDSSRVKMANSDKTRIRSAAAHSPDTIISVSMDAINLAHELVHVWDYNLAKRKEFETRWEKISGKFIGEEQRSLENLIIHGSISYHALENIREDVAETAGLVYALNDPRYAVIGFPNRTPDFRIKTDTIPTYYTLDVNNALPDVIKFRPLVSKLMQKVGLLQEYGFCSEREAGHAIGELDELVRRGPTYSPYKGKVLILK